MTDELIIHNLSYKAESKQKQQLGLTQTWGLTTG